MVIKEDIEKAIKEKILDAKVHIITRIEERHNHQHIIAEVKSKEFRNKSLIEQHRMIYDILKKELKAGEIHALKIKTIEE